jgi:hypothetical protein
MQFSGPVICIFQMNRDLIWSNIKYTSYSQGIIKI